MTQNSSNQDYSNETDGFILGGGTIKRKLTLSGADVAIMGSGTNVYTMPSVTDTLVGRASTDTLTNKTLTSGTNTFPTFNQDTTGSAATLTTPRNIAGVAFNGSANISLNNNAITNGAGYTTNAGDVTLTGSQTLTNKTLTSPVVNSPTGIVKGDVGLSNVTNNAQYYPGGTDVAVADGGTGSSTTSGARTNLGVTDANYKNTNTTKGDVGLGNVDNTSNATERAAAATLTNKDLSASSNTFNTPRTGIDWSSFSNNMKSAKNGSTISPSGDSDLASNGVSVSFTVASNCNASVTVSIGLNSAGASEFRTQIRLGGTTQLTMAPTAQNAPNGRGVVSSLSYVIPLTTGVNVLSAGVFVTGSPSIDVGNAMISAIVLGDVTA